VIILDEKIVGVWFLNTTPKQDVLFAVREVKQDEEYELVYRFRYYNGDQTKSPFEDGDKKSWYKGKISSTRNFVISSAREAVKQLNILSKRDKDNAHLAEPYELINDNGLDEFYRKFQNAPFVYAKQVSKKEYEEKYKEVAG
jgi:hypothetical protein